MDANKNQQYSQVEASSQAVVVSSSRRGIRSTTSVCSDCDYLIITIGTLFAVPFIIGAIFFGGYCAQVLADEIHGTVYWSPYLAGMLALLGLLSQSMILSIPFHFCIQRPTLQRYANVGVSTAKIIRRSAIRKGRKTYYKVVLIYLPYPNDRTVVYEKEIDVKREEYDQSELPILVLPDVPTSATLKRRYNDIAEPCSIFNIFRYMYCSIAPTMWFLATIYTFRMQKYSLEGNFWIQYGLQLLFLASCVSSVSFGYVFIAHSNKNMLYGKSNRVSPSLLPQGFLDDQYDDEDLNEKQNEDNENLSSGDLELV